MSQFSQLAEFSHESPLVALMQPTQQNANNEGISLFISDTSVADLIGLVDLGKGNFGYARHPQRLFQRLFLLFGVRTKGIILTLHLTIVHHFADHLLDELLLGDTFVRGRYHLYFASMFLGAVGGHCFVVLEDYDIVVASLDLYLGSEGREGLSGRGFVFIELSVYLLFESA